MDSIEVASGSRTKGQLSRLPLRLHHNAFVVKNHEVNRRFFEDLLGIPLVAI
jgi:glyoxylase I family protein